MATSTIKPKFGTTAQWAASGRILEVNEWGVELTESGEYILRIGDGEHRFNELAAVINTPLLHEIEARVDSMRLETSIYRDAAAVSATEAATSAESAASAKTAAQSALTGVQNALNNLPEGDTLVINDLTTGGASAALSAEMGKVLGQGTPVNILDNSDWSNPVDQMHGYFVKPGVRLYSDPSLTEDSFVGEVQNGGLAEYVNETYGKVGDNYVARGDMTRGYFSTTTRGVDRWRTTNMVDVEVEKSYIHLRCRSTQASNGMSQNIPDEKLPPAGEMITVAVYLSDGTVQVASTAMPDAGARQDMSGVDPENRYTFRLTARTGETPCRLSVMVRVQKEVSIRRIAMYHGKYTAVTLPPYQPKGYGAELLECQRYYQLFSSADAMPKNPVDYRPTMRANPATGTINIDGVIYWYADANQ